MNTTRSASSKYTCWSCSLPLIASSFCTDSPSPFLLLRKRPLRSLQLVERNLSLRNSAVTSASVCVAVRSCFSLAHAMTACRPRANSKDRIVCSTFSLKPFFSSSLEYSTTRRSSTICVSWRKPAHCTSDTAMSRCSCVVSAQNFISSAFSQRFSQRGSSAQTKVFALAMLPSIVNMCRLLTCSTRAPLLSSLLLAATMELTSSCTKRMQASRHAATHSQFTRPSSLAFPATRSVAPA
mmetsp:Transcript_13600/g.34981  ORF Transcript_13600/g.34981 Transcript_13600/m.34981 type:complete len:238 (+) Transcript_13600:289-1002(+)